MTTYAETRTDRGRFLRQVLLADAGASGAMGVLMALGAALLTDLLGLPLWLLVGAGVALLPYAALLGWLATRPAVLRPMVWAVIVGNLLWAADSVLLLVLGWVEPTTLGTVFVLGQAAAVAALADLQYLGLRHAR
jgi:hypothetical protein